MLKKILILITFITTAQSQAYTYTFKNNYNKEVTFTATGTVHSCKCTATVAPGNSGVCTIGGTWCKGECLSSIRSNTNATHTTADCGNQTYELDGNNNLAHATTTKTSIQYTVTNNYPYALKAILKTTQAGCCNGSNCSFTVGAHSTYTYTTPLWQGSNGTLLCAGACMHNLAITLVDAAGNPLKFDSHGGFSQSGQVYSWTLSNPGSECQSKTIEISPSSSNSTIGSASIRNTSDKPETSLKTFGQFIGEFAWEALEALGHE